MPESAPKDLRYAENLRREGKVLEALKVINDIEKKETLTPGDQLSLLISKGKIYTLTQQYRESSEIGEEAYKLSQGLGRVPDMIMALLFKANVVYLGEFDEPLDYLNEAEGLLNSLNNVSLSFISRQKANILLRKAWAFNFKGELDDAIEAAMDCLEIQKKLNRKSEIATIYQLIGSVYFKKREIDVALDYLLKSVKFFEEIGDSISSAWTLAHLGMISFQTGDINNALAYCKKSLSTKLISDITKNNNYGVLGGIYNMKGELDRAIKYYKRGISLAEKLKIGVSFINFKISMAVIYVAKREYKLAIESLKSSLSLAKEANFTSGIANSLLCLMLVYSQMDLREELQHSLDQLKDLKEKYEVRTILGGFSNPFLNGYRLGKAWLLIKSGRSHNRAEAEKLLKQVVQEATNPMVYHYAMSELCEFYLEELHLFNEPEILEELDPLITQLLKYAKDQSLYRTLAEAKLLQAKLALIQMNFEDAQQLLTQAQRVAELYGLNYIAQRISSEHDNYLKKLSEWKKLKERDAPIAERLQGKRAIEPPEIVEETPILLLIMDESGNTFFNHSFSEKWDFHDLFSSFMSAFNTFSGGIFSKSIDRIKIGENTILIHPVESFLTCYVIKGQSYPAQQKLSRFTHALKNSVEIWDTLNKAVRTSEMLELNNPPSLGAVINEIFTH